jgi:DNA-binding protein HU-beta
LENLKLSSGIETHTPSPPPASHVLAFFRQKEIFMNYAELVAETASATNLTKAEARKVLDAAVKVIGDTLSTDADGVTLGTLGKFDTKVKPARTARNPKTGASIQVPAKTVVDFKVSKALKDAIA